MQVRCDSEKTARLVVQQVGRILIFENSIIKTVLFENCFPSSLMQISYARNVYEELTQAVIEDTDMDGDHTEL